MRRLFWLSVGAGAGVYATRRVNRFTRRWTPENVVARTGTRLRLFAEDVRLQMHAREAQLREALEQDGFGTPHGHRHPRALPPAARPPRREPPPAAPRRVLKGQYTIINDDKDGH